MMNTLEIAVKEPLMLKAAGGTYLLVFTLAAVIEAEAAIGRSLKTPADWFLAEPKDIPALLLAGLRTAQPSITPDDVQEICNGLSPESATEVIEALGAMNFPRFLARVKENLEGAKSPNAGSAGDS